MKNKLILPLFFVAGITAASFISKSTESNTTEETKVLICNSTGAYAYHKNKCSGLQRCKAAILSVKVEDAKKAGRKPCKICYK